MCVEAMLLGYDQEKRGSKLFDKRFFPHLWLLIIYIPFVFFIKNFLPENVARENGPIENFQLVLLAIGVYLCWQALKKTNIKTDKYVWQAGALFYVLLFLREISWGRALLMRPYGMMPQWNELGLYGVIAHPLIGVAIVYLLILFYRGRFFSFLKNAQIPLWDLLFLVMFVILVDISEHYNFSIFNGMIDEELFECAMYFEMLRITSFIKKYKVDGYL